jgi:hypothetical protein
MRWSVSEEEGWFWVITVFSTVARILLGEFLRERIFFFEGGFFMVHLLF